MLKELDVQAIRRFLQQIKDAAEDEPDKAHVAAYLIDRIIAAEHGYNGEDNVCP